MRVSGNQPPGEMTMDAVLLTAMNAVLAKLAKANGPLAPGNYAVDETVTIRLAGSVDKAEDEVYTPTIAIPVKAVLGTLLPRLGATREAGMAVLIEAMTEAVNLDVKGDSTLKARMKDVDAAMAQVESVLDALPPKTRTGKTFVDATLAVVPTATLTVNVP